MSSLSFQAHYQCPARRDVAQTIMRGLVGGLVAAGVLLVVGAAKALLTALRSSYGGLSIVEYSSKKIAGLEARWSSNGSPGAAPPPPPPVQLPPPHRSPPLAASRAVESAEEHALVTDPLAERMAGPEALASSKQRAVPAPPGSERQFKVGASCSWPPPAAWQSTAALLSLRAAACPPSPVPTVAAPTLLVCRWAQWRFARAGLTTRWRRRWACPCRVSAAPTCLHMRVACRLPGTGAVLPWAAHACAKLAGVPLCFPAACSCRRRVAAGATCIPPSRLHPALLPLPAAQVPACLRAPEARPAADRPTYIWTYPAGHEPRQLVMLGAGMDSRPWRMKLPAGALGWVV